MKALLMLELNGIYFINIFWAAYALKIFPPYIQLVETFCCEKRSYEHN